MKKAEPAVSMTEELNIRLPWKLICGLACRAMIEGLSFEQAVERAVSERVARENSNG